MLLLILFITPLLAMVLSLLVDRKRTILETIGVTSACVEFVIGILIFTQVIYTHAYTVAPYFSVNALGALILGITVTIGLVATLHSVGYLRAEQEKQMIGFKRIRECYILMRLFLLCMFVAITTTNPIIMWIAIEATTLSTVFLISFFNRKADIEAAWKYLIINSVGLLLGLLGTLLFLSQAATSGFATWNELIARAPFMNAMVSKFAFIFIFIGYGTKMGLVPMHTWKPDTYNKAPLPVVALLSGALINVAFFALLHFKILIDTIVGVTFSHTLFLFFGTISILIPALIIYSQVNYKRMLAYSSIEHAGIMLLGFGFGGIGIFGSLLHMMYHAFAKSLLFLISSNIAVKYSSSRIEDIKGMIQIIPYSSILYIIGFLALVGIPPSGIFFSELYISVAGFMQYPWITLLAILLLLLVFAGFFRHVTAMLFGTPPEGIQKGEINPWAIVPIAGFAIVLILFSVYLPSQILTLLHESEMLFAIK